MCTNFKFAIDRGGTFTDIYCEYDDVQGQTKCIVSKLLSNDPNNYKDAPTEGIRRTLQMITGITHSYPVDSSRIQWIRMGTTVATNALLERKGKKFALIITKGFKDLLIIGNQSRPDIFKLNIQRSEKLFAEVLEVDERVKILKEYKENSVQGTTGEYFEVITPLDIPQITKDLQEIRNRGIDTLAISLVHAYSFRHHESQIEKIAKELGFVHISLASTIMPLFKFLPRTSTACVDAYLTPILQEYINSFRNGFDENLSKVPVLFMQSDGGLCDISSFIGSKAILSGPAGGVVGFSQCGKPPLIGFDMGGTSTDVSRFDGNFSHIFETEISGVHLQGAHLDISSVAAGGGSRLFYRSGLYVVGPESSSADPGPLCYRKNGFLSITDANLVLGRVLPDYFPKIFGPSEDLPLDYSASFKGLQEIAEEIFRSEGTKPEIPEIAMGFIKVANEAMCRPIRAITSAKGYDPSTHTLACFGGAGGQHACAIARSLGIKKIIVHRFSGVLSAYGLGLADIIEETHQPANITISEDPLVISEVNSVLTLLTSSLLSKLAFHSASTIIYTNYLHLRFSGSDTCIPVVFTDNLNESTKLFENAYLQEYGFILTARSIIIDSIRVKATIKVKALSSLSEIVTGEVIKQSIAQVYFETEKGVEALETPVYKIDNLPSDCEISGPALIVNEISCIVVEPNSLAKILESRDVLISLQDVQRKTISSTECDNVVLSLFAHRFMSIAEQMGRTLQRTAISTNIKERLDYSCAIFSSDGSLVANAPHLPVHLGSMQEAVKKQIEFVDNWQEGEVAMSNHPCAGGSHLPDITVITPVFSDKQIVFFVASRGHHADIGGITPGSMPPFSKTLAEEGVAIKSFKLVENFVFRETETRELFRQSRCIEDNISDLKAQTSANNKGIELLSQLINEYSLEVVLAYMKFIQKAACQSVKDLLQKIPSKVLKASDFMDDGTKIKLVITINSGCAEFNFTGTGHQVLSNLNSPAAVVKSAVLYCLRCLVDTDIPLNQGCLDPVTIIIPENSILSPSEDAAVVGGNVLTSQRITDVVFKAFSACAASQGCMNNLTFGNKKFGFYETIAGGSGAGSGWHGTSGVHTHMTNTRITDIEIMERRYPVLVRVFSLRDNSGGKGFWHGGDGVIREIEFLEDMEVGILSERRSRRPYGLNMGKPGKAGLNLLLRKDGRTINIGSKNVCLVEQGDKIRILTPGGGGYGTP